MKDSGCAERTLGEMEAWKKISVNYILDSSRTDDVPGFERDKADMSCRCSERGPCQPIRDR